MKQILAWFFCVSLSGAAVATANDAEKINRALDATGPMIGEIEATADALIRRFDRETLLRVLNRRPPVASSGSSRAAALASVKLNISPPATGNVFDIFDNTFNKDISWAAIMIVRLAYAKGEMEVVAPSEVFRSRTASKRERILKAILDSSDEMQPKMTSRLAAELIVKLETRDGLMPFVRSYRNERLSAERKRAAAIAEAKVTGFDPLDPAALVAALDGNDEVLRRAALEELRWALGADIAAIKIRVPELTVMDLPYRERIGEALLESGGSEIVRAAMVSRLFRDGGGEILRQTNSRVARLTRTVLQRDLKLPPCLLATFFGIFIR